MVNVYYSSKHSPLLRLGYIVYHSLDKKLLLLRNYRAVRSAVITFYYF